MQSPSLMKLAVLVSAGMFILGCSRSSFGDNVPTYVLTSGSAFVAPNSDGSESIVSFSFTGPGGIMLSGSSHEIAVCTAVPGGSGCDPSTSTQPFDIGDSVFSNAKGLAGQSLFSIEGITINAIGIINLPMETSATTLTFKEPVIFSGTFGVCTLAQDGNGCASDTLATFKVNGSGFGIFQFTFTPGADNTGFWTLTSGTYILGQTPEPSSIMLVASGVIGLGLKLSRRKRST